MQSNNYQYILSVYDKASKEHLENIADKALEVLRKSIEELVYSRPESEYYTRTYQLRDDIAIIPDFKEGVFYLAHQPSKGYVSWVIGYTPPYARYATDYVPYWTHTGHSVYSEQGAWVGYYDETGYLTYACDVIEKQFGVRAEVVFRK